VKKQVAVIGAGPAGLMTAMIAAKRGHRITLFEREKEIGGMLRPGSRPAIKYDILNYRNYLEHELESAQKSYELLLRLGAPVDITMLKDQGFDTIICATGTTEQYPPIEGIDTEQVVSAVNLLNNPEIAADAERVVIIGGGDVGCETAYYLAHELKKNVTIVEMLPELMKGSCTANRGYLLHHLEKLKVTVMNCTEVLQIKSGEVSVNRNISKTVPDPFNTWNPILPENVNNPFAVKLKEQYEQKQISTDMVVLAAGVQSNDALYLACVQQHAAKEVLVIGDAFAPGRVFEAVKAAYQTAITV